MSLRYGMVSIILIIGFALSACQTVARIGETRREIAQKTVANVCADAQLMKGEFDGYFKYSKPYQFTPAQLADIEEMYVLCQKSERTLYDDGYILGVGARLLEPAIRDSVGRIIQMVR